MNKTKRSMDKKNIQDRFHCDWILLTSLMLLIGFGLVIIYSAVGRDLGLFYKQVIHILLALLVMFVLMQVKPRYYEIIAPALYVVGVILLIGVLLFGQSSKGAQRWLHLGFVRFQPSELLKIAVPLMVAHYIGNQTLPPKLKTIAISLFLVFFPTILIAKQPDLGTSILIASSGIFVIFLAGISWKLIWGAAIAVGGFIPVLWFFLMHEYQKVRVRTLFNPEADPLGAGYHILQSKIAIGSGGLTGKGWLQGTQSQLEFLPEHHTDFIFAVIAEEWGMFGVMCLLLLYLTIIGRGLYLASTSQTAFGRMMAGSVVMNFSVYIFVNIGMVSGILPVVGVPLPLISYGGTSMVTLMAGFGILMSLHSHRNMLS